MDGLIQFLTAIPAFFHDTVDFLAELPPEQFVRVFWAFFFLEIPRYLFSDLYVLYLYLRSPGVNNDHLESRPLVSVVIAALNEADTIGHTIQSVLEEDNLNIELIVVDDGSTDATPSVCAKFAGHSKVRYFRLDEREGKSAALNYGFGVSRGEYVVFMDSDSTLDRDAIWFVLEGFKDPSVGAVSGNLGVRNSRINLLTRFQAIEYLLSITVGRWFKASMGILAVVPGAFGAFRRDLLERVGVHEPGPGNDSDLTIRIRKLGARVAFAPQATCLTTVPRTWRSWLRQRMRWGRNITRNRLRRHKDVFNLSLAHFNWSNLFAFVDTLFFGVALALVWVVYLVDIVLQYPDRYGMILFLVFLMHLMLRVAQFGVGLAVSDRRGELLTLAVCLPLFGFYRIALKLVRIAATVQELLFRWSYRDPFAPAKVRREAEVF